MTTITPELTLPRRRVGHNPFAPLATLAARRFQLSVRTPRELLAAPIPRSLLVLGNLAVAFAITALQVAVLIAFAIARGIHFNATATGVVWFVAATALFTVGMYGVGETLASRIPRAEEYIARLPA